MGRSNAFKLQDSYAQLIRRFPLRPIRSDKELDRAIAIIDELVVRNRDRGEQDYLDVLSDLVEHYEETLHPIEPLADVETLRALLAERDQNQRQVALGAGIAVSTICDILAGRRKMNRAHIEKLARHFNIEPGLFLEEAKEKHRPRREHSNRL